MEVHKDDEDDSDLSGSDDMLTPDVPSSTLEDLLMDDGKFDAEMVCLSLTLCACMVVILFL